MKDSSRALKEIVKHTDIPIVADIVFIIKAIEAARAWTSCLESILEILE